MRHPDIVFKPKFRINGHDLRYPIVYTTTRQFFFGHLNGLRMQKSGGQCCCLARLGFGFLAGVVALKPWLLLRGRRCTLHHLLTWNTKPAGHACLFDGPMTTQCDIFLSSVSCWLFLYIRIYVNLDMTFWTREYLSHRYLSLLCVFSRNMLETRQMWN